MVKHKTATRLDRVAVLCFTMTNLRAHDVITSIDKHNLSCNSACQVARQEEGSVSNLALLDITAQRGGRSHLFAEACETRHATGSQGIQWPGRNGIDANIMLAHFKSQVAYTALQSGLCHSHHIILGHDALASHVGQGENTATMCLHKRLGSLSHGDKRISANI